MHTDVREEKAITALLQLMAFYSCLNRFLSVSLRAVIQRKFLKPSALLSHSSRKRWKSSSMANSRTRVSNWRASGKIWYKVLGVYEWWHWSDNGLRWGPWVTARGIAAAKAPNLEKVKYLYFFVRCANIHAMKLQKIIEADAVQHWDLTFRPFYHGIEAV